MSKYKFYKNRITKMHPSLQISENGKSWKNMEMTSHPAKNGRYIPLKQNPGPNKEKQSYIRKYLRNDPIRTRGELLEKYNLSEEDLIEIEHFLFEHSKNKKR